MQESDFIFNIETICKVSHGLVFSLMATVGIFDIVDVVWTGGQAPALGILESMSVIAKYRGIEVSGLELV